MNKRGMSLGDLFPAVLTITFVGIVLSSFGNREVGGNKSASLG